MILEAMYNGGVFYPCETVVPTSPEYRKGDPNLCGVDGAVIPAAQQRGLCSGGGTPGAEPYRPV